MQSITNGDLETTFEKTFKPENKMVLEWNKVHIRIDEDGIYCKDKTDIYNEQCIMTQSKRWVKSAILELIKEFDENETDFAWVCDTIRKFVKKTHTWCAID